MNRLFALLLITVSFVVGCNNGPINNNIDKNEVPNLYVSATASTVDATGEFTIYSDVTPKTPIMVSVKSINDQILTITDAYVTIEKGEKEVKGKFKGVGEGKAMILITSKSANIGTGSVEVAIGKALPKLSITAEKIDVDEMSLFTIHSDVAVTEPIKISITSSDNDIISVLSPTLIIQQGEKTTSGTFQALKKGVASLTITANGANIIKDKHEVTVGDVAINHSTALSISASSLIADINRYNYFYIHSDKAAVSKITVTAESSDENVIQTVGNLFFITKGNSTVEGQYKAVGAGKAKLSITTKTEGVIINKREVEIKVNYPILAECDEFYPFPYMWFADETSGGFTLWYNSESSKFYNVYLENLGADYYGSDLILHPVERGINISTLALKRNEGHILVGTNTTVGYNILPTFTQDGTYFIVFNVANGVYMEDDPSELTYDKVAQKPAWALVTVTMNNNKADKVVLHDFKCPATIVGE